MLYVIRAVGSSKLKHGKLKCPRAFGPGGDSCQPLGALTYFTHHSGDGHFQIRPTPNCAKAQYPKPETSCCSRRRILPYCCLPLLQSQLAAD